MIESYSFLDSWEPRYHNSKIISHGEVSQIFDSDMDSKPIVKYVRLGP